jgi:hypothetical protein
VAALCHPSLAGEGHSSPRRSTPVQRPHGASSLQALRTSVNSPPRQSHDGGTSQANHSRPGSPSRRSAPDIELIDTSSREVEEQPPPDEAFGHNRTQSVRRGRPPCMFSLRLYLCGIAVFLGPVNIVSGMTASHGDNWKLAFVG